MTAQEVARGMGAVHLEALVAAAVARHQADVVEHRAGIEQFRIEFQAAMNAGERAEMIDAARMVEQQFRFGVADIFGDGARQLAVGNGGGFALQGHGGGSGKWVLKSYRLWPNVCN